MTTSQLFFFAAFTIACMIGATSYIVASQTKYIKDNWSELRCNPAYMAVPFLVNVGVTAPTNFYNCTAKTFSDFAGLSMDVMNSQMGIVSDSLGSISQNMSDMRGMMGSTRGGFMMVFQMVFGKIQNLMSSMQYLMIRIRTLMGRIVGVFASIIYAFYAGEQTAQSVWNGPIGYPARHGW